VLEQNTLISDSQKLILSADAPEFKPSSKPAATVTPVVAQPKPEPAQIV